MVTIHTSHIQCTLAEVTRHSSHNNATNIQKSHIYKRRIAHHLSHMSYRGFTSLSRAALAVRANLAVLSSTASAGRRLSSTAARYPNRRFPVSRHGRGRWKRWSCRVDQFRTSLLLVNKEASASGSPCLVTFRAVMRV